MSSSLNSSNARSTRRIFHCLGQSVATVMSPSGGTRERSGTISITSARLQKVAGKRGQTIRTLIADPSGGQKPNIFVPPYLDLTPPLCVLCFGVRGVVGAERSTAPKNTIAVGDDGGNTPHQR